MKKIFFLLFSIIAFAQAFAQSGTPPTFSFDNTMFFNGITYQAYSNNYPNSTPWASAYLGAIDKTNGTLNLRAGFAQLNNNGNDMDQVFISYRVFKTGTTPTTGFTSVGLPPAPSGVLGTSVWDKNAIDASLLTGITEDGNYTVQVQYIAAYDPTNPEPQAAYAPSATTYYTATFDVYTPPVIIVSNTDINNSGTINEYGMSGPNNTYPSTLDGAYLGSIDPTNGYLKSSYSGVMVDDVTKVSSAEVYFRVYKDGATPGNWQSLALDRQGATYAYGKYQDINLINGLTEGLYHYESYYKVGYTVMENGTPTTKYVFEHTDVAPYNSTFKISKARIVTSGTRFNVAGTPQGLFTNPPTGAMQLNNADLGLVDAHTQTLSMTSSLMVTHIGSPNTYTDVNAHYRVYKVGATPGNFITLPLTMFASSTTARSFRDNTLNINLLQGITTDGNYVIEQYFDATKQTTLDGSTTSVVELDNNNGSNYKTYFTVGGLLPVKFAYFNATAKAQTAVLNWGTAMEQNAKIFHIERSADGANFAKIGNVAASGNSTSAKQYQFVDANPLQGDNYYRIVEEDNDGKTTLTEVKKLNFAIKLSITLSPNPVKNIAKIEGAAMGANITIADAQGRKVMNFKNNASGTFNLSTLPSGVYFATASTIGTQARTIKFVKE